MKKALGKGLDALFLSSDDSDIREIKLNDISPGKQQPRKTFDEEKLNNLSESIKKHGVVQPIIVCKENNIYRIVAGERRWRAARKAGLLTIPAIIREYNKQNEMEIALIENIQREDLNPLEEAEAYKALIDVYGLSQQDISIVVGKSRSAVANSLRILNLADEIKDFIGEGVLTEGHARALLSIQDDQKRIIAAKEAVEKGFSVRECERLSKKIGEQDDAQGKKRKKTQASSVNKTEYDFIENSLRNSLGTKVKIQAGKSKGKIIIEYYSNEELDRILSIISNEFEK